MGAKRIVLFLFLSLILTTTCYAGGFGFNVDYNKFQVSDTADLFDLEGNGDFGLGVRSEFGGNFALVLSFDYYFPQSDIGSVDFYEFNGNLIYNFPTEGVRPYIGGGLGIARVSLDTDFFSDSSNETGWNILGGLKFGAGGINPFAEVRYVIYSGDEAFNNRFVASFGILF
jgi:opacity protein-like surface antigen